MTDHDQIAHLVSGIKDLPVWLQAIWESTSDAIAVSDADGLVLIANPAYLKLYGFGEEEVVGRSFAIIFPEEQRAWAEEQHRLIFTGSSSPKAYDARIRRKDGTERAVVARADFVVEGGVRTAMISTIQDVTDRLAMETALRESEARLRLALDSAETGVFVWDPVTDRTDADERVRAVLGHGSNDEFSLGAALGQYIHPDDRERYTTAVEAMLDPTGSGRLTEEVRWRGADGCDRWVQFTGRTIFSEDSATREVVQVLGSVVDVTDRRRTQDALRESEQRLRLIVDNAVGHAIFVTDRDGRIADWFPGAEAVFGWTSEEVNGKPSAIIFTPEDLESDRPARERQIAETQGSAPDVRWHRRKDGSRVFIDGVTTALRDEHGKLQGFLKVGQDVTQRHWAEQAVQASEARFRTLIEAMDQGFTVVEVLFDEQGQAVDYVFLEVNQAFERNTGLADAIGRRIRDLVPTHEDIWFETYGRVALTGEPARIESEAAGLGRWYEAYAYRVDDADQHRVAVLFQDITHRKRVEQELEQGWTMAERAVAARDRFLSIGAHELRTPITGLRGTTDLLTRSIQRGTLTPDRLERYIGSLAEATERLETMVTDLFDVARLYASESGQIERHAEQTELGQLVRETIQQYWRGPRGTRITTNLAPGPVLVVERERIRQVVVNLIENALKYSPGGGRVEVTLSFDRGGAALTVRDEGIGLPANALASIFEPFNRASNAAASSIPGMGLGLYICQEIAEAHGGRLTAESAGEGLGTTMTLWLPMTSTPVASVSAEPREMS